MKNIPLLRKTLEYAEAHPEEIDLGMWAYRGACGTTACIAGVTVTLTGHTIDWERPAYPGSTEFPYITDGRRIEDTAREELGLTGLEVNLLFYQHTLDQVWETAEEITDGEISKPLAVPSISEKKESR